MDRPALTALRERVDTVGNDLYRRTITFDYEDEARRALMEKVWSATPYMVDTYTGQINDAREREMLEWCRDQFGDEAWPIHGRLGAWQRGGVTMYGWTWFGFDDEEKLNTFIAAWPLPDDKARSLEAGER